METQCQRVKLSDGHFIPILGFGTSAPEEVPKREDLEFTKFTLDVGFRHTDCTHAYKNEENVGQVIRSKIADGTVKREDIFYTSKVECHPYLNQSKLLEFCKSHDIVLVAYGTLGSQRLQWVNPNYPNLLEDPVLCAIAKKHKQTPALVALRYRVQRGVVVLAKSFNKKWIKENIQVMMMFDFELTPEDMEAIDGINRNMRYYEFLPVIDHPEYPYSEEY
ncbi:prostaglandin F synthase 1-like [Dama dama]|uniref:prostaglandin F synthase 1-like n=1 Tax=Dama dama TaxID=30532 RepID=UPI002A369AD0|nr:prostaglandin F synthase 1-like [Dama dama]